MEERSMSTSYSVTVTVGFDDHDECDARYTFRGDWSRADAQEAALERFSETFDTQGEIARTIVKRVERRRAGSTVHMARAA
jgi:hypothetical protein